ncbi:prepilin-type N-terminal cleavage/methylation domain-containing protein [Aliarcobacter butzleri]|uniref:Prepilin-type N-terminal cleavage/methylation domain-containing protein n=1 Tax=Aliarcobacter butzleri TaxID=28197 RepID=A0AAW7QFY3_9BACT|nr:prepilin-type N-terminal cleavage/methylation domain-containing protein [Aliarcobacter butzleri]MDN5108101.1 prepilin-type N-terminal cleavage/methylation domain-containing protein [Aliarcobacter butzleri]MDN5124510.1 prepilin-type N-terminal cleavage/methylation domain-containing protein [Aliarcobacter butzleri]
MNFIGVKKAFTLIELIIVILIILTVYSLIFSNKNFSLKEENKSLNLSNLREFLIENFDFKKELLFICIEDNFNCFIKIDDKLKEDFKIENFFEQKPKVYEYIKYEKEKEFKDLRVENFDYKVIFELKINSDYKIDEFIIDILNNKVYVFNSIFKEPIIYKSLEESLDIFNKNQNEVLDAF